MCTPNKNDLGLTDASCACGTHAGASADSAGAAENAIGLTTSTWLVSGMTCGHCVESVTEELGRLDGAQNVEVSLASGGISQVTVASLRALDPDAVAAAVGEAGYKLVTQP